MGERKGAVTFKGGALTLIGDEIHVDDRAPDVELIGNDMKPVKLSSYGGKVLVLLSVPSLDTPVCDTETRRFNREAAGLGPDVQVVAASMDLPFAQARWCAAADVNRVRTLSDYRDRAFGEAYGVFIKELGLLARAIFVVDRNGVVRYMELVKEITNEPDYKSALDSIKKIV